MSLLQIHLQKKIFNPTSGMVRGSQASETGAGLRRPLLVSNMLHANPVDQVLKVRILFIYL